MSAPTSTGLVGSTCSPSLLQQSIRATAARFKKRTETEINGRFLADMGRIGRAYIDEKRDDRLYGFRSGGAMALLNKTGLLEQVMRLGGWWADSSSFFKNVTAMDSQGTLRSTLRSLQVNEVTQVVAQVMETFNTWTAAVVRDLTTRALGQVRSVDAGFVAKIEANHVKKLCSMVSQCNLVLHQGTGDTEGLSDDDEESDELGYRYTLSFIHSVLLMACFDPKRWHPAAVGSSTQTAVRIEKKIGAITCLSQVEQWSVGLQGAQGWGRRGPERIVMCSATHSLHVELIAQMAAAGICWCGGTPTMAEASASSSCRRGA